VQASPKRSGRLPEPQVQRLGLKLLTADLKDLMISGDLKKSFVQVVKARKEGEAALERARGETAALRSLANAARMLQDNPQLMQLRMLQAMGESAVRQPAVRRRRLRAMARTV
jgi:regulator of protease activity HflC (stomatin/prohibitin superfamily)